MICFEDIEIDRAAYEVRRGGQPCPVEPQVFDLLVYLADNAGRLVTKDELIEKIWGGRIVSDSALASRIKAARRAIGDDGEQQRLIRTVHGRGVRFIGKVAPAAEEAVAAPLAALPAPSPQRGISSRPSIGISPLRPFGSDAIDRHLAEALTEDLITSLTRDRGFVVLTQGDLVANDMRPHGQAQQANPSSAGYLIEGRVRRSDGLLVVTIRLTSAADGRHIWAERLEQSLGATLALDERVALRIAAATRGEIESAEARNAAARPEQERDAWAFYHLGLREMYRFTRASLSAARTHLERALAIDADFSEAHARLAYVHIQDYWYGPRDQREGALDRALDAAARAIATDPKNALGFFALGRAHALRHSFDRAMPELETAIRLNPGLAQAYFALGQAHFYADRPKEAVRLLDTAIDLDPQDPHLWAFLHDQSDALYALGRLDKAADLARAASGLPNATHWPLASLASVLGSAGKIEEAEAALHELRTRLPNYTLSFARTELSHLRNKAYVDRFLEGLKAAGLRDETS